MAKDPLALIHPDTLLGALVLLVVFIIGGLVLSAILGRGINLLLARDRDQRIDRLAASFLSQLARVVLWLFVLLLYTHAISALDRLGTALLASVSIASVVIGLAAQSTLANLVAGIFPVLYKPFRMGDRLQVAAPGGTETGVVENVLLGYTVPRTFDNHRVVLSSSTISCAVMFDLNLVSPHTMAMVPFSIGYRSSIDHARADAAELAAAHKDVEEVVSCTVVLLDTSSVDLPLHAWCRNGGAVAGVTLGLLESIKKRFDAAGIEIPFAYRGVAPKSGRTAPPRRLMGRRRAPAPWRRAGPTVSVPMAGRK